MMSEQASVKRRRRTRYTPQSGVMKNAVYLARCAWPPMRRARLGGHDAVDCLNAASKVRNGAVDDTLWVPTLLRLF